MTTGKAALVFVIIVSASHAVATWASIAHDYLSPPIVETRR
jgi:hypothetical protein